MSTKNNFILTIHHLITAAWIEGVLLTNTTATYYIESLDVDEIQRIIDNSEFIDEDEKNEAINYSVIERLSQNKEFISLKEMDDESAQYIIQSALTEYIKQNPGTFYEGFAEVIDLLEIYCTDFIPYDFFKQSLIDQAANLIANTMND